MYCFVAGRSRLFEAIQVHTEMSFPDTKVLHDSRPATLVQVRRSKVLVLADSFLPHAGGSREYYHNIYRSLLKSGKFEVTILTKKVPGWREFDNHWSCELFRIERRFNPLRSYRYSELPKGLGPFFQALWHVMRHSPDIIHAGDLYPQGFTALLLRKILGLPYIVYCHGEEITQTDRFRYQPKVRNWIYKNADAVIANSEFARHNLLRIGVRPERITKITPGVDAKRFRPQIPNLNLRRQYNLQGKTVILTVARLVPRKGHRAALEGFAAISRQFPEAHYLIVGTGPEEAHLRRLTQELQIQEQVTFAGLVPGTILPELYGLCDIMLLANRQETNGDVEGFGIVFLEANAAGKAVIGGRSGGAVEAVLDGVTGYLANSEDPIEIGNLLRRLLSDRALREKMGAAGARRASLEFTWEERARMLETVNSAVLAGY